MSDLFSSAWTNGHLAVIHAIGLPATVRAWRARQAQATENGLR